jgi:hypothetical protein
MCAVRQQLCKGIGTDTLDSVRFKVGTERISAPTT